MGDPMTKMDERGQEPVDEHRPVLRAGAHRPLPRPSSKPRLVTLLPQRADLLDEFSDPSGSQARDPPIADHHRTSRVPHHPTMINHPGSTSHRLPCTSSSDGYRRPRCAAAGGPAAARPRRGRRSPQHLVHAEVVDRGAAVVNGARLPPERRQPSSSHRKVPRVTGLHASTWALSARMMRCSKHATSHPSRPPQPPLSGGGRAGGARRRAGPRCRTPPRTG